MDTLLRIPLLIGMTLLALVSALTAGMFDNYIESRHDVKTRQVFF